MKTNIELHTYLTRLPVLGIVLIMGLGVFTASCYTVPEADPQEQQVVTENYVPPSWAPPYDNVSQVRYYYFPDCEIYYDVWGREFYYENGGGWISSFDEPPVCSGMDLNSSFIVLIDRDEHRPWERHSYYRDNYPRHGYDNYKDIVVRNRIVTNIEPHHELVPRAFNENNNKVTFMQHPIGTPNPPSGPVRASNPNPPTNPSVRSNGPAPHNSIQTPAAPPPVTYHHVVHEVPIKNIAPSMPKQSQSYNYGRGVVRSSTPPQSNGKRQ